MQARLAEIIVNKTESGVGLLEFGRHDVSFLCDLKLKEKLQRQSEIVLL
jgi:hypothetical protein